MKLVIANKCYSSWSLRPWLVMRHFGIFFEEVKVPFGPTFDDPAWKAEIARYTPAGKVPALVDGDIVVWESLAIIDYLADMHPDLPIWPRERAARAMARSLAAEMHAGFSALRSACPMNLGKKYAAMDLGPQVARDVARAAFAWREARERFGAEGPFLFGAFTAADAMYAPVVTRLETYSFPVDAATRAYMDAVLDLPAFRAWREDALAEPWIVAEDEVDAEPIANYRKSA
ncbi:Glutathione S-transferase [Chelatococcus sambhunathii]|uniref:Glutathione S-transferase n=1 Tax=Chelatococcus sambhunathii TaxID=363953 RepID=A0ABP2A1P7_9HYPH|nr:glutathione S-transferase family protein [Chelatococcus sambhunathii]CUA84111.1 Glutathione S-transferase [Chelatococcus sambhunathii]